MKYKVSREELEALLREVSNPSQPYEKSKPPKTKVDSTYNFLCYKCGTLIKKSFVSNYPIETYLKGYNLSFLSNVGDRNVYTAGFDVEGKYRVFLTVGENIDTAIHDKRVSNQFNGQQIVEKLSTDVIQGLREDFPFIYKKIYSFPLQFYSDELVRFEYLFSIEGEDVKVCLWLERDFIENGDINRIIYSPPTSVGKRKLKGLKELLKVDVCIQSEPIQLERNTLQEGQEIDLNVKFSTKVCK
ncbi:MAG: hypothetical protein GXO45_04655 [Aquificae bacterium]|nr:hypothetical protein [Aquificota bacterium]